MDNSTVTTMTENDARRGPELIVLDTFALPCSPHLIAKGFDSEAWTPALQPPLQPPEAVHPLIEVVSADPKIVPSLLDKTF